MCDCDHSEPPFVPGQYQSINSYIQVDQVKYLNCANEVNVFDMANTEPLSSDCDDTMILQVPFSTSVRIHELRVTMGKQSKHLLLFKNRAIDFDDEDADQLIAQFEGEEQHYPVKASVFTNVTLLQLYFKDSWRDEDVVEVVTVDIRGEAQRVIKQPVVTMYEVAANPQDHPNKVDTTHRMTF